MEQEKLYSPLGFYLRDTEAALEGQYDEMQYWRDEISHEEAFGYLDQINSFLLQDQDRIGNDRGLMAYCRSDVLSEKVYSLIPAIELHGDKLWCVADVRLNDPLTPLEMADLKSWWGGQLSDGWGEGLEQREIMVDRGELYIEPWTASAGFFIATQAEFDRRMGIERPAPETQLPELDVEDRIDNKEAELFARLDTNLSDYCENLIGTDERELIGMAEDIAARFGVRDYLKNDHKFKEPELDFLLGFRDPLEVVAEHTPPIPTLLEMSGGISELANLDGALRREYPLAQEYTALRDSLADRDALLTQIAQRHCHVETLETRKSDSLDFHDVSVWGLKDALEAAFKAGAEQQLAKETRTASELPDAAADVEALRQELTDRLEQNYAEMMNDYRSDISVTHLPTNEFVELADRISRASDVYEYLTDTALPEDQVAYLLNFQCPLEVVTDSWPAASNGLVDMDAVMDDICDNQDALQGDYALVSDAAPAREEAPAPAQGKRSLLAGLREAQAKTEPPKDKNHTHKPGPEL